MESKLSLRQWVARINKNGPPLQWSWDSDDGMVIDLWVIPSSFARQLHLALQSIVLFEPRTDLQKGGHHARSGGGKTSPTSHRKEK